MAPPWIPSVTSRPLRKNRVEDDAGENRHPDPDERKKPERSALAGRRQLRLERVLVLRGRLRQAVSLR